MDNAEFFRRFGAASRTRYLKDRPHPLPKTSELPADFIRLCPWEAEYLFAIARRAKHRILETGRFNGGSCFLLACAAPNIPVYSIDLAPRDDALLRSLFAQSSVGENAKLIVGDSQHTQYPEIDDLDLLFIDGDHSYDGCKADIENWFPRLRGNGHLIFHDCYLGQPGVMDAVAELLERHLELQIIQPPFIGSQPWRHPTGSLAHFIKRNSGYSRA
jgi:predicted O-methyltransferase YrrM